jgi:CelD/BcsL family acetyltransferase involved in cellulose biosynthesis
MVNIALPAIFGRRHLPIRRERFVEGIRRTMRAPSLLAQRLAVAQTTDTLIHPRVLPRVDDAPPVAWVGPAASAKAPAIALTLHRDMASAAADWRAFEQTADCTPFQTFAWLAAWDRHVGGPAGIRPAIVIGRRGGDIAFVAPLAVEAGRLARRLTFLGQALCDYNAPLLAPGFADTLDSQAFAALWRDIRALLQADPRLAHDIVEFTKMPATVGAQANPFAMRDAMLHPSGAYQANLGADWETFYSAKRSSATRRRDRTKLKKLGDLGEVRFVTPDAADTAATLDTLIRQKSRAFARMGVPDLFARPGHAAFFHEIAASRDFVHISRLDVGAAQAAVNLGLTFRDCYYHILASYDDGEVSRFGPGAAHLRELLRYATEHGMPRFDFTIGDEPYKRDWCDTEQALYDHVSAATARGAPFVWLSAARRRAKRAIKHNAALWAAVVRVRSTLGLLRKRDE